MLTIRAAQLAELGEAATKRFVEETAAELRRILPRHCEALRPEGVRDAIRAGAKQASAYGIVSERGAAGYVRLMFMFGTDFDRKYEWARQVLEQAPASDGDRLAANLAGAAEQFLRGAAYGIPR
jgi:hypothetical protein